MLIGAAYSSQKNWSEAEKSWQKSVELNKGNGTAYIARGSVENEKKSYADAEKYLLMALLHESADAHTELGRAYWGWGRWDVADQQVAKANQLRPDDASQRVLMGNLLLRERNAQGALKEFKEALRLSIPMDLWPNPPAKPSAESKRL